MDIELRLTMCNELNKIMTNIDPANAGVALEDPCGRTRVLHSTNRWALDRLLTYSWNLSDIPGIAKNSIVFLSSEHIENSLGYGSEDIYRGLIAQMLQYGYVYVAMIPKVGSRCNPKNYIVDCTHGESITIVPALNTSLTIVKVPYTEDMHRQCIRLLLNNLNNGAEIAESAFKINEHERLSTDAVMNYVDGDYYSNISADVSDEYFNVIKHLPITDWQLVEFKPNTLLLHLKGIPYFIIYTLDVDTELDAFKFFAEKYNLVGKFKLMTIVSLVSGHYDGDSFESNALATALTDYIKSNPIVRYCKYVNSEPLKLVNDAPLPTTRIWLEENIVLRSTHNNQLPFLVDYREYQK